MTATPGLFPPPTDLRSTTLAVPLRDAPRSLARGAQIVDLLTQSPRVLYWTLQIGGWTSFGLSTFLTLFAATPAGQRWPMLASKIVRAALGFGASLLLTALYRSLRRRGTRLWQTAGIAIVACVTLGALWTLIYRGVVAPALLIAPPPNDIAIMPRAALDLIFVLIAWSGLYAALIAWRDNQRAERDREVSHRLAADARYRMLAAQLNPHFLFNALNSVRALTVDEPTKASDMITALSDLLRSSLSRDPFAPLPLADEIRLVEQYLSLERVRFEERLDATVSVDTSVANALVPPNMIQPLVENAMKYGSADGSGTRQIRVLVSPVSAGELCIVVANRGVLAAPRGTPDGTGLGLASVCERLGVLYRGAAAFALTENDGWVRATVTLPLERPAIRAR